MEKTALYFNVWKDKRCGMGIFKDGGNIAAHLAWTEAKPGRKGARGKLGKAGVWHVRAIYYA